MVIEARTENYSGKIISDPRIVPSGSGIRLTDQALGVDLVRMSLRRDQDVDMVVQDELNVDIVTTSSWEVLDGSKSDGVRLEQVVKPVGFTGDDITAARFVTGRNIFGQREVYSYRQTLGERQAAELSIKVILGKIALSQIINGNAGIWAPTGNPHC